MMLYSGGGLVNGGEDMVLMEAVGVRVDSGLWIELVLLVRVGVGEGVISVEGETSTSSASRYHFRRRVYRPQPSTPLRPFCHCSL